MISRTGKEIPMSYASARLRLNDISREQQKTFQQARRAFAKAAGLGQFKWAVGIPAPTDFGRGNPSYRTRRDRNSLPAMDHWETFGKNRRLAAVASWPYHEPEYVRGHLAALGGRFTGLVVDGDHPAARIYPTHPMAFVLVDRETCGGPEAAEEVVDIFHDAEWATRYVKRQADLQAQFDALYDASKDKGF